MILAFTFSCACPPPPAEPPDPEVELCSEYFDPDDGHLTIILPDLEGFPIVSWKVEIFEPQAPYNLFYDWSGDGIPPEQIIWDGKGHTGDWVHSASEYPLIYSAYSKDGNSKIITSKIVIDAFVIKDGAALRITVPSIVFCPDSGSWDNLDDDVIENNRWIISRIALALEKHSEYMVRVEGHANYTINPSNIPGRQHEQTYELQPLSEIRAKTVVEELIKLGIDSSRLSYYGIGGEHPLASWDDHDNWWKNRRVEFLLIDH
jgi:hypothetical protein